MALYAFDGTWNENEADPLEDTNVVKFVDAFRAKPGHKADYIEGVGTRFGAIGRVLGGVFGAGGQTRIEEMYEKLVANWQQDDQTIDIIGFSRGAALAVHFSNVIDEVGIVINDQTLATPRIRFLGVWDVVGSFGLPINFVLNFQDINMGYDLTVPDSVDQCFHAMALNERRQAFDVQRLDKANSRDNVTEMWFRGVHSDVGGGSRNKDLANIALHWMMRNAREHGLPFDQADIDRHDSPDPMQDSLTPISDNFDPIENPRRVTFPNDAFHETARGRTLQIGDVATFTVRAEEQYSWSGVRLEAGGHYAFLIADSEKWTDDDIECGPDGWRSEDLPWYKEEIVELFEGRRRCPSANWFELVGSIGDNEDMFFRIGNGGEDATYTAPVDGGLFAFANDLRSKYDNNHGEIAVTMMRVDGPGARRLKSCSEA